VSEESTRPIHKKETVKGTVRESDVIKEKLPENTYEKESPLPPEELEIVPPKDSLDT
jgi:hypothetical protein